MKKLMTITLVVMMLLGLMVPVFASAAGETETKYVNTAICRKLNLRETPSTDARILKRLKRGTAVTVLQDANATEGWAHVRVSGKEGYVMTKYLAATKPANYSKTERVANFRNVTAYKVAAKAVNGKTNRSVYLRVLPNKGAKAIRRLTAGNQLRVIATGKNWNKVVDLTTGRTGYVASAYVSRI